MSNRLENMVRAAYTSFGKGDLDGYWKACGEGFSFHVPGGSAMGGVYRGKEGLSEIARRLMRIAGMSFEERVDDVLANDDHAIVLAHHRFVRDGEVRQYHTVHVYRVRDGLLAECWEHPGDQATFDAAWGPPLP